MHRHLRWCKTTYILTQFTFVVYPCGWGCCSDDLDFVSFFDALSFLDRDFSGFTFVSEDGTSSFNGTNEFFSGSTGDDAAKYSVRINRTIKQKYVKVYTFFQTIAHTRNLFQIKRSIPRARKYSWIPRVLTRNKPFGHSRDRSVNSFGFVCCATRMMPWANACAFQAFLFMSRLSKILRIWHRRCWRAGVALRHVPA